MKKILAHILTAVSLVALASSGSVFPDASQLKKSANSGVDAQNCARGLVRRSACEDSPGIRLVTSAGNRFCEPPDRHSPGLPFQKGLRGHGCGPAASRPGDAGFHRKQQGVESAKIGFRTWDAREHFSQNQARPYRPARLAAKTSERRDPFDPGLIAVSKSLFPASTLDLRLWPSRRADTLAQRVDFSLEVSRG